MEASENTIVVRPYLKSHQIPSRMINSCLSCLILKMVSTTSSKDAVSFVGSFILDQSTLPQYAHLFHENILRRFLESYKVLNDLGNETANLYSIKGHHSFLCVIASSCFFASLLSNEARFRDLVTLKCLISGAPCAPWMAKILKQVALEADGKITIEFNTYSFIMNPAGSPNYFVPVVSRMERLWDPNPEPLNLAGFNFDENNEENGIRINPL